ncbi:APC family permease [Phenylobacterium sp.]|uniref:APC family permease n=1 Tax=Phenylobacterium sp. TaxID=1871053 RepID=UPI00374CAD28
MSLKSGELLRSVGVWGLAAMAFNSLVGAGVFSLPGVVAQNVGPWAPVVVLGVGLAMLPVVVGMAALAGLFDRTGGPIVYVGEAFGPAAGFQAGWLAFLSTTASVAANANLLADYILTAAQPPFDGPLAHAAVVLAALAIVLAVNLAANRRSADVLQLMSLAKIAPLLLLLVLAAPSLVHTVGSQATQHWSPAQAVLLAAYAFVGFEGALTQAGEARNPRRDLPLAVLCVFVAVVILYAALTWGFIAVAYDPHAIPKAPLARMGEIMAGRAGLALVVVGATLSILGNVISTVLFNSRRLVALEAQGSLPRWLGWIAPANGIPRHAVLLVVGLAAILALSGGFKALAILSVASRLLVYLASMAALPVIRGRRGLPRFAPVDLFVMLAVPVCLAMLSQTQSGAWLAILAGVAVGFAIMAWSRRTRLRAPA